MPRRLPVALGAACLLLAGVVTPVGSITAQADPLTQTESREIESRVSPQSGTPADGAVGSWSAVAGGLDGPVNAIAFWDDTLVAGGQFQKTSDTTVSLNHVGAFDPTDDTWLPLGPPSAPGLDNSADALTVWRGDLIAGGEFRNSEYDDTLNFIGVLSAPNARWHGLGQADDTGLDDRVYSLTVLGDMLVAGGDFTSTFEDGVTLNNVGAFDPTDDTWVGLGPNSDPGLRGNVLALTTWDDTLVAGGDFETTWDGSVDLNFVGAFSDTDDTWVGVPSGNPGMAAYQFFPPPVVRAADSLDQLLVVGGDFEVANQQGPRDLDHVGLYSPTSQSWIDLDGGVDDPVYALAVDDTRSLIYVGGVFEYADDLANSIAVWDAGVEQWVSFTWGSGDDSVGVFDGLSTREVRAIALDDSVVYVGGDFPLGIQEHPDTVNIARWTWDPPAGDGEYTGAPGQRIRVSGEGFIGMTSDDTPTIGGAPVTAYTRISSSEIAITVPPGQWANAPIRVTAIGGTGEVGTFTTTPPQPGLGDWSALGNGIDGSINSLTIWNDSLLVGGSFECARGPSSPCAVELNNIGAFSTSDDSWHPIGPTSSPGLDAAVSAVTMWDDTPVAGGFFGATSDGSITLNKLGAYSASDDTWVPVGDSGSVGVPSGQAYAFTEWDDSLITGGSFASDFSCSDSPGVNCVGAFPSATAAIAALGDGLDDFVYALGSHDDTLYAGGGFGWQWSPQNIAAFSATDDTWVPLGAGLNDSVDAIASLDDLVIAGGSFSATFDDGLTPPTPLAHIAGYSPRDDTWTPIGSGLDRFVATLASDDTRSLVYAGGAFGAPINGQPGSMLRIGTWDAALSEWIPFSFDGGRRNGIATLGRGSEVYSIAADDEVVYVGGLFPLGIEARPGTANIARWTWDPPQGANTLSAAGGATVTITGAGFIGMSPTDTVRFGTTPVTSLTRLSSTQLRVVVPPGTFTNAPIYVDAVGGRGQVGTFSTPSGPGPGPTPLNPPSAPLNVTATPGDSQATVTWNAPTSFGSFPITRYEVRSTPAGGTCLVAALTCTITGLTNRTAYTFEVRALNGAGWGPWSTPSSAVTPVAPPPPLSITITGSRGTGAERQVVFVTGTSTGLDGEQVRAHVKLRGQAAYRPGRFVDVSAEGRFAWQRTTGKKTYVYFTGGGVQSNRVIIPAARR